ncbi:unnamed protein product [Ceratitis capitata]|uniref:(Mediterranean fruit fly) hypothetical protein n=1 Tax=Ceratitis capitata TaxID=7213 RepID=A0A811UNU6_CERCA|nr:unnamed protein product [Ceratitis capitata]
MGVKKTFARVSQKFYCPKMKLDIAKYARACKTCQQVKPENSQPAGGMIKRTKAVELWEMICVDLVGPLVKSTQGYQYILTVVDYFSKFPLLSPLRTATAKSV